MPHLEFTYNWSPQEHHGTWKSPRSGTSPPTTRLYTPRSTLYQSPRSESKIPRAISLDKLVIRKGANLDSLRLGSLLPGRGVLILEENVMPDGSKRTRVGKESSPRGFAVEPLGWVTSIKDGEAKLAPLADGAPDATNRTSHLSPRVYPHEQGGSPRSSPADSMASRIAARRREKPGKNYEMVVERLRRRADMELAAALGPPPEPDFLSADMLLEKAHERVVEASDREESMFDTTEEQLAFCLLKLSASEASAVIREWDEDGNGQIDRDEFRQMFRKIGAKAKETLGVSRLMQEDVCPDAQVDALHRKLDTDGNGMIDQEELEVAFSKMKGNIKRSKYSEVASRVSKLRAEAEAYEEAAALVTKLQDEEALLEGMRTGTVASRLGDLLKERKIKVGDLKAKWDGDGNGKLDFDEFRKHLSGPKGLGFEATEAELSELFNQLDNDQSGSLASKELVAAMTKLKQDSMNKNAAEAEQVERVEAALHKAKRAQKALKDNRENVYGGA